jgi:hypothetical protein
LPQVCNVSGNPDLLNYSAFDAKGAMVYDTCAGKIKRWSGSAWVAVADSGAGGGGSGDYVDTIYRKAGQDSIFYTINGGSERAVKDSVGSGGSSGVNYITADKAYVGVTSGNGSNGTDGGTNANGRNMFIGDSAGHNITSQLYAVGLGYRALYSLQNDPTGLSIGPVAIGNNALKSYTGGTAGTALNGGAIAIGNQALENNTTSTVSNGAIGNYALNECITCKQNFAFGGRALRKNTGDDNIGIGYLAQELKVAGDRNVVIGSEAMPNAAATGTTTNGQNIVIGYRAMNAPTGTIGGNNIAIGSQTLNAATFTGSQNIAIGLGALGSVTSATRNIAIGPVNSGNSITTGSDNIIISGFSGGNITTGTRNILLGGQCVAPSATLSDQIIIGNIFNRNAAGQINFIGTSGFVAGPPSFTSGVMFEMVSTTGGFRRPTMTTAQRNAIASPAAGLSVYNSSLATNDVYTTAWYQQPNGLSGSGTLDFPSTGAHSSSDLTITVTGAAVGDIVILGTPVQDIDGTFTAFVSAANTVTVRYNHYGSGTNNPASGTFKVYVIKN